jgi:chemotaxis protein MotB
MINAQNEKVRKLLQNVKDALLGFSSDELTVREEGGKVYVAMSDKLLFESGKAIVNEQGRAALGKLAQVLNKQTDIDVYIEGHTDNVPIKTAVFQDNWDLSVIRATSVVRILTETYGVNPLQIQPCGRGEFKPVDVNTTPEGRARNRRTEIIMAPRLDKLFKMLEESKVQ